MSFEARPAIRRGLEDFDIPLAVHGLPQFLEVELVLVADELQQFGVGDLQVAVRVLRALHSSASGCPTGRSGMPARR